MFNCTDHVSFQIVYLGLGDTLLLQTGSTFFTGALYHLTFCITLTGFDYCILDNSCEEGKGCI